MPQKIKIPQKWSGPGLFDDWAYVWCSGAAEFKVLLELRPGQCRISDSAEFNRVLIILRRKLTGVSGKHYGEKKILTRYGGRRTWL